MLRLRRYKSPDGHDWRDPEMPVIRNYRMIDGSRRVEVDPSYEHRYREHMVFAAEQSWWNNDPTYNLRRRKHVTRS